jgi:ribosomal protein L37E
MQRLSSRTIQEGSETMKDFVKGKIIMQCPKCGEHAPNLIFEGCFKCGFKPEVRSLCKPKRRGEWK